MKSSFFPKNFIKATLTKATTATKFKELENMKQRFIQIIYNYSLNKFSVENILFQRVLMDCESSVAKEMVENNPLELL